MAQKTFNNTKINVEFDEATSRQQLNSGENISTLFGKVKKIFSDLKAVCFSGSYIDLSDIPTTATTEADGLMSASDKTKLDNADDIYALKSKYGDTTINVGRKDGSDVGEYSTAEGLNTTASGYASHAEGSNAYISKGEIAFYDTRAVTISDDVTVEVDSSQAYGVNSHAEGCQTLAYGNYSHAEGVKTTASGGSSHAEGAETIASGGRSHAEGMWTIASGGRSHAEGMWTIASGGANHAEGYGTTANGNNSCHAEGYQTTACGIATHVEGSSNNKATDLIPDLSWSSTITTNDDIINAWNLQKFSLAHGRASHVEGHDNLTLGYASHAEGQDTVAIGDHSHTSGYYTKALHENEAAYGKYNVSNDDTLFSIGDGTADDARHNAFEITTTGGKLHDKDIATMNDLPNPNLLTNPDFSINQREISGAFSDTGKYFVDRWRLVSGTVTVNSDGTLTLDGSICQPLENAAGANVTASVSAGTAVYDDTAKIFTITGNGVTVSWAKLEIGSAATDFSPPDPAAELMKCYRFFYRVGRGIANPNQVANMKRIDYQDISNKKAGVTLRFPVEMRVSPTVTISGTPWCFRLFTNNRVNVFVANSNNIIFNMQKYGYEIVITNDYFANATDGFIAPVSTSGYTDFDAEIY